MLIHIIKVNLESKYKKLKKIIIFASQPLEKRNYYRFGLDIFSKENWQVIYCNLAFSTFKYDTKRKK